MHSTQSLLVSILAKVDAIFSPRRDWSSRQLGPVLYELRATYLSGQGIPWTSGGTDTTARRKHQMILAELEAAGWLKVIRMKARATGVALTDEGDAMARDLASVAGWDAGWCSLQEVARRIDQEGFDADGKRWMPETALAGVKYSDKGAGKEFGLVEELAAPALVRGWLESNSDMKGHAAYAITPAGQDALENPPEAPECDGVEACPELAHFFEQRLRAERTALMGMTPRVQMEIGEIPLPVSTGQRGRRKKELKRRLREREQQKAKA